jgi:murein L,D-transpeptidase YafK
MAGRAEIVNLSGFVFRAAIGAFEMGDVWHSRAFKRPRDSIVKLCRRDFPAGGEFNGDALVFRFRKPEHLALVCVYAPPVRLKNLQPTPRRKALLTCLFLALAMNDFDVSAADIPSSSRSRAAIAKVKPMLVKECKRKGLRYGAPIFIRIFKESRELEVWIQDGKEFKLFRIYEICRHSGELGPKLKEGDRQSPEGFYAVGPKQMNLRSRFHLSFNLGFPNAYDRARGRTGSFLMVHGACASIGCYAMTDSRIEEIYALADAALRNGQPFFRAHCFPFRMTTENLARRKDSRWLPFWTNLKTGYDWFEKKKTPPDVRVNKKRYVFAEAAPAR